MFERIISKLSLNARAITAKVMQEVRESKWFNDEAAKTFLVFFFFMKPQEIGMPHGFITYI